MTLGHRRLRLQVSLLAAGALSGAEREETLAHLETCARCRAEHDELRGVVSALEEDPLRAAEPELPLAVVLDRVERALDRACRPSPRPRRFWVALPVAAALVAALAIGPALVGRLRGRGEPASAAIPEAAPARAVSGEVLERLERNVAREHAARYLSEASEVLVAVAAAGLEGDPRVERLDVGEAPARSRALLRKGRLVESDGEAVASAQGVLDDVQLALREVAELPASVERRDVERVRERVERRQLLMRIRLMTRELEG